MARSLTQKRTRRRGRRVLGKELLEPRLLLAVDLPFQNPTQRFDVNRDLSVSALDALQILNFIGENGFDAQLPNTNDGKQFPDVNGSNSVTALDALQIINQFNATDPLVAARLVNDSAPGDQVNLDFVTNEYDLEFGVSFGDGSERLEVRIGGVPTDPFVDAGSFDGGTPLLLTQSQLDAIAGDPLSDGDHTIEMRIAEKSQIETFVLTVDTTAPASPRQLGLTAETDTGRSNTDGRTNISNPSVKGDAELSSLIDLFVDAQPSRQVIAGDGWQIDDVALSEGVRSLAATATDIAGNESLPATFEVEIDTVPPSAPEFDLSPDSDTGSLGDQVTLRDLVNLIGQTDPQSIVQFPELRRSVNSDVGGRFNLLGLSLSFGSNLVTAVAEDLAGNEAGFQRTITQQAPSGFRILQESSGLLVEQSQTVELGQVAGSRTLRFEVDPGFDRSDNSAAIEDLLAVYLVDPANRSNTILDRGEPGTALFTLAGEIADFVPGLVRFDGRNVEIDVTNVAASEGELLFQLINSDLDTGTEVAVGPVSNHVDPDGAASPRLLDRGDIASAGDPVDLNSLEVSSDVSVRIRNVRLDSSNGDYRAEISLQNNGEAVGNHLAVVFPGLPTGVVVEGASGADANGDPYFNFSQAGSRGGLDRLAKTSSIGLQIANPSLTPFSLQPVVLSGGVNRAPVIDPLGPLTVMPGDVLEVPLIVTDPDGDDVTFSIFGDVPTSQLTSDAKLIFTPTPSELGSYTFDVIASDSVERAIQSVTIDVVADSVTTTRISGRVLNIEGQPLAAIPVELGVDQTVTEADGGFTLDLPSGFLDDTLKVRGEAFGGPEVYPFIAEKLSLVLPQGVFDNMNNVIGRPIFLPALDIAGGTDIDPAQDITISPANLPGVELFVGAGTLKDQQGNPYSDRLSITEVPVDLTPAALPTDLLTDMVVTIQPGEMVFETPAPLTFPNRSRLDPGTLLDLYSINPITGQFDIVGMSQVSSDGSVIETISGGVRNSSWHLATPLEDDPKDPRGDPRKEDDKCDDCKSTVVTASEVALHSGILLESHQFGFYQSLQQTRGATIVYDSQRADPRPILPFGFDNVPFDPDDRLVARAQVHHGPISLQVPGIAPGAIDGVTGGENFWKIPAGGGSISASLQIDMSQMPTARYHYEQFTGIARFTDGTLSGALTRATSDFVHINSIDSPFGAGWGLSGLTRIFSNQDGSLLLVDGDGGEVLFEAPEGSGDPHVSPAGDFSTLQQLPGGGFVRSFPSQTVETYNASGRIAAVTDRNNNTIAFSYDNNDRLTTITDPVGLSTTFNYTGQRVTSVVDPANRVTQFDYDGLGNLIRITDADGSTRNFTYDRHHRLVIEIDKRGFQERVTYGFHGRVEQAVLGDGSEVRLDPLQTQGLFPPQRSIDPINAPTAIRDTGPIASSSDPRGNVTQHNLDKAGQLVSTNDSIGAGRRIVRDDENLIRSVTDARGNTTFFEYDPRGNRISIIDSVDQPTAVKGEITSPGEIDLFQFTLSQTTGFYIDAISEGTTAPPMIQVELEKQFGSQWLVAGQANLDRVDSNGVTNEEVVRVLTAGTYRIHVSGLDGHVGSYMFRPQSITAGIPIALDQPVAGVTEEASGSDLFTIDGREDETWFVTTQQLSTPSGAFIRVLDPSGDVLSRFVLNGESGPITLPADGTYTILVEGDLNASGQTNYAFTVRSIDSPLRNATLDQTILGSLSDTGQIDRYSIVVTEERLVRLDVRQTEAVITATLTGPSGELVEQTNLTAVESSNISIDNALLLEPGSYQLQIEAIAGPGRYELQLVDLFSASEIEFDQRVSVGSLDARLAIARQLEVEAGDQLRIDLLNRASLDPANSRVTVFDRYGTRLLDASLANSNSEFTTTIDGPLIVYFDAPVTAAKPDFYTFAVTKLGNVPPVPSSGIPLTFNQRIESVVSSAVPNTYEFTLNQRTLLRLDPQTGDSSMRISLHGDPGTLLDDARFDFNQANRWFNLPAGHYQIEIRTTATSSNFSFAVLVADQNVFEIGDQLGIPLNLSLESESTQLRRVTLAEATSLFADFDSFDSAGNWSLANSSGQVIASETLDRDLNIGRLDPGTYFLALDHLATTGSAVPLAFVLREQNIERLAIALGDPITGVLEDPGDRDIYEFTLDHQTLVHLTCQSPASTVRFSIDGPTGTLFSNARMADCAHDRTDISDLSFSAPPGDYTVTLDSATLGNVAPNVFYDLQLRDFATAVANSDGDLSGSLGSFASELFAVEFPSKSEIKIESNGNDFDLVVELTNADGTDFNPTLRFRNDVDIPISDPSITVQGSYFIVVHNRRADSTNFSYTINTLGTLPNEPGIEGVTPLSIPTHRGTNIQYDPVFNLPIRVTTSEGRVSEFELDPTAGNVLTVTRINDAGDDSVDSFTYNAAGQVLARTDGEGRVIAFAYTSLGRLETITEAPGTPIESVNRFEYDDAGNRTTVHTPRGATINTQFDPLNRVTRTESPDPDGVGPLAAPVTETEFDSAGNAILLRDALGRETRLVYDARDRLLQIENTLGEPTQFIYDTAGNVTRVIDARGNVTRTEFDSRGRSNAVVDALGNRTAFAFDPDNNLTHATSPLDEVTRFEYDARSRITVVRDALGNQGERRYDRDNLAIERVDANGNSTVSQHDSLGRLASIIDALENETTLEYDRSRLIVAATNPLGQRIETQYDDRGRAVLRRDAIGGETLTGYDLASNVTSATDELGNTTTLTYDLLGRLTQRSDPDPDPDGTGPQASPVTSFAYDITGNLVSRTDAAQNTTSYLYDGLNRVTIETGPRLGTRNFTYDAAGNLTSRTNRNGQLTTFDYDSLNRQVTESWLDENGQPIHVYDFAYDAVGRLLSAVDTDTSVSSTFDAAGRITAVTQHSTGSPNVSLGYSYDAVGNRIQSTEAINGVAAGQTDYFYDALNRQIRVDQLAQTGAVDAVQEKRIDLFYNALGQFERVTRYADLAGQSQVAHSQYAYDGRSRLQSLTHRDATDAVIAQYAYQYDARSLITQIADVDGTTDYTYDGLSRLIAGDHTDDSRDESYEFDAAGNRTSSHLHDTDYVTETGNLLTDDGTFSYQHDAEGNLTRRIAATSGEVRELEYDHRNRLIRVTDRSSSEGVITAETTYRYDAFNRRVAKIHDADGAGAQPPSAEYYVSDFSQIVLEFIDSDGPGGAALPVLAARNLYAPRIDFLLAVEQPQQSRVLWTLGDHQNSTRDIVNSDGSEHNHLTYDAYGNLVSQSAPSLSTRFLYTGRELDSETGLYYYRERYYDPSLGRFISEDPIGFEGGNNLFAYVDANPVNRSDPFGREPGDELDDFHDDRENGLEDDDFDVDETSESAHSFEKRNRAQIDAIAALRNSISQLQDIDNGFIRLFDGDLFNTASLSIRSLQTQLRIFITRLERDIEKREKRIERTRQLFDLEVAALPPLKKTSIGAIFVALRLFPGGLADKCPDEKLDEEIFDLIFGQKISPPTSPADADDDDSAVDDSGGVFDKKGKLKRKGGPTPLS